MPKKIGPQAQILAARAENSCRVNEPNVILEIHARSTPSPLRACNYIFGIT